MDMLKFFKNIFGESFKEGEHIKVYFPIKFADETFGTETLWCQKVGRYWRVDNIPFYATNIALNDLIEIENEDKKYWFKDIIEESGHSVVQLKYNEDKTQTEIGSEFELFGCTWEGFKDQNFLAINIPAEVNYEGISNFLQEGFKNGRWSYNEACLGSK